MPPHRLSPEAQVNESSPGLFVHTGVMELFTSKLEATIANVDPIPGADTVAVIYTSGTGREI